MDVDDPYSAYCLDTACEYIAQRVAHGRLPKFPDDVPGDTPEGKEKKPTTNSELIAEMQRTNKRK